MKKYHSIIKLIVVTAALAGLGVIAFKYLHNHNNDNVEIQTLSQGKVGASHTSTKTSSSSGRAQATQPASSSTCGDVGNGCSGSGQSTCCSGYRCCQGKCRTVRKYNQCENS